MKKYIIKSGAGHLVAMGESPLWSTDPVSAARFKEEQARRYQRSLDQQGINAEIIEVNIVKYGDSPLNNPEAIKSFRLLQFLEEQLLTYIKSKF